MSEFFKRLLQRSFEPETLRVKASIPSRFEPITRSSEQPESNRVPEAFHGQETRASHSSEGSSVTSPTLPLERVTQTAASGERPALTSDYPQTMRGTPPTTRFVDSRSSSTTTVIDKLEDRLDNVGQLTVAKTHVDPQSTANSPTNERAISHAAVPDNPVGPLPIAASPTNARTAVGSDTANHIVVAGNPIGPPPTAAPRVQGRTAIRADASRHPVVADIPVEQVESKSGTTKKQSTTSVALHSEPTEVPSIVAETVKTESVVEISIATVEVNVESKSSTQPVNASSVRSSETPSKVLSLDDYLARRTSGGQG